MGTVDGWNIIVLNKWAVSLIVFSVVNMVLFIDRYWQKYDKKKDRDNTDIRGTHHFSICSWVFLLGCIGDKCLVICSDLPGDCRSIHGTMFRRWRGFVRSDSWYIHGNEGNNIQMVIFDLINSIFKYWFRFEFCCFNSSVHTKLLKILFKRSDIW